MALLQLGEGSLQPSKLFTELGGLRGHLGGRRSCRRRGDLRRSGRKQLRLGVAARVAFQIELLLQRLTLALVRSQLLLEPLQPLAPQCLPAHQVAEERAQRLQLGVWPVLARAQLGGGADQFGLEFRPLRPLCLQALVQLRGGRGAFQPGFLLEGAGDGMRFLEKRSRHRLALRELGDLGPRRLELAFGVGVRARLLAEVRRLTRALTRCLRYGAGHEGTSR